MICTKLHVRDVVLVRTHQINTRLKAAADLLLTHTVTHYVCVIIDIIIKVNISLKSCHLSIKTAHLILCRFFRIFILCSVVLSWIYSLKKYLI